MYDQYHSASINQANSMQSKHKSHNPSDNATVGVPGVKIDKELLKKLIIEYNGNLTKCAIALGCARHSLSRIARDDESVKSTLDDARERILDLVEDTYLEKVLSNTDTAASIFYLKTKGRTRGYDQDPISHNAVAEVTRSAMEFALNKSRNPADNDK
jgi:hypothetical protein